MFPLFDIEFSGGCPRKLVYDFSGIGMPYILPTENNNFLSLQINFKEEELNIFLEDEYTKRYFKNFKSYLHVQS